MPEIVVELKLDQSPLNTAIDELVASGKITKDVAAGFKQAATNIDQVGKSIAETGKVTKKNLQDLATNVKKLPAEMQAGFKEGIADSLKEAGITMQQFEAAMANATDTEMSLRQELKQLTQQIAQMTLAGDTSSEMYNTLVDRAGEIKDAMGDAAGEINRFASDTAQLDQVISIVSGVAAAFNIMQGAEALMGDENEEVTKSLQKLQAGMSLLMGVQEIANLLQKQSAAMNAIEKLQRLAATTAVNLETAAKSRNIIVSKAATVTQWLLNAAMAANPAYLLIAVFAALAGALVYFSSSTETAAEKQTKLNEAMAKEFDYLDQNDKALRRISDDRIQRLNDELKMLQARGASQNQIMAKEKQISVAELERANLSKGYLADIVEDEGAVNAEIENTRDKIHRLNTELAQSKNNGGIFGFLKSGRSKEDIQKDIDAMTGSLDNMQKKADKAKAINDELAQTEGDSAAKSAEIEKKKTEDSLKSATARAQSLVSIAKEGTRAEVDARINALQVAEKEELANVNLTQGERLKIVRATARAIRDEEFNWQVKILQDRKALAQASVLDAIQNTQEEFDFQKAYLKASEDLELKAAKDNEAAKALIRADYRRKEEDYNRELRGKRLENAKSNLDAENREVEISNQRREEVTVASLNKQREIELNGVVNNLNKVKEINSRYDEQIRNEKVRLWEDALNQQLALQQIFEDAIIADYGREIAAVQRKGQAQNLSYGQQNKLAQQNFALQQNLSLERTASEAQAIADRIALNQKEFDEGTISKKQYNDKMAELTAKQVENHKAGEDEMTALTEAANIDRAERTRAHIADILGKVGEIFGAFNNIMAAISEGEIQRIEERKKALDQEKEAGTITAKEYAVRAKKLENEEIAAKTRAAKREKAFSLFQAVIAGARAVVEALPDPFLVAFATAMSLAQIAAIALKPIPKFGKGTRNAPKGLAEVGETGTELIHTSKGYYVADHPQVIWMKGGEKIYNPSETERIFNTVTPKIVEKETASSSATAFQMDYERLGHEIAKHPRNIITLDEHGFTRKVIESSTITKYKNKRFTFND